MLHDRRRRSVILIAADHFDASRATRLIASHLTSESKHMGCTISVLQYPFEGNPGLAAAPIDAVIPDRDDPIRKYFPSFRLYDPWIYPDALRLL
jgi:hypothetical protein